VDQKIYVILHRLPNSWPRQYRPPQTTYTGEHIKPDAVKWLLQQEAAAT